MRKLYDLAGADDRRFSPYCWRSRMALAHKGLAFDAVPCRYTEKDRIAFSGQKKLPVLADGEAIIADSWDIAGYLEDTYPEAPALFGGDAARQLARFVNAWTDTELNPALLKVVIKDVFDRVHPDDRDYFRRTREDRFGSTLEELHANRDTYRKNLSAVLPPLEARLSETPYLCGDAPAYADYIVFGSFQWVRVASPLELLDPQATLHVHAWRERLLDHFDGVARQFPAAA